jgi:transcriptional regulator GlxA family with amidase domain
MKIAYIIFDGITWLDLIGIYDPISRLKTHYLPELAWDVCSLTDTVQDNHGLSMCATKVNTTLNGYDVLIVPGGVGTRTLIHDNHFIDWIKTAQAATHKISICTGSLILGAAGFLKDKVATTHFGEYETLKPYCRKVVKDRIVVDGDVITAGAVAASIDLGLYLCSKWTGADAATDIRRRMNYQG